MLITQNDEEIHAALLKTDEEHEKVIAKFLKSECFFDLQFIWYYKIFELLRRWMMKHHNQVVDFSNLDFETIDTETLTNEAREQEEAAATASVAVVVRGDNATDAGRADQGHEDEVSLHLRRILVLFFFRTPVASLF